jgi:hypothetical protein
MGLSGSCRGPAPNPSSEIENAATLTLLMGLAVSSIVTIKFRWVTGNALTSRVAANGDDAGDFRISRSSLQPSGNRPVRFCSHRQAGLPIRCRLNLPHVALLFTADSDFRGHCHCHFHSRVSGQGEHACPPSAPRPGNQDRGPESAES